jgi:AFG3 family protein
MFHRIAVRSLPLRSSRSVVASRTTLASRLYATPSNPPKPQGNTPHPAGLEGLFGGTGGSTVAPKPAGSEPPAGPSQPKIPNVDLPGGQTGPDKPSKEAKEQSDENVRRPKLSDFVGGAGKKAAMGGGGGPSGGGGGPGSGGPGGPFGLTGNQILLATIA